jgi:amidohydrolase
VSEKTGLPYASTVPGVMHACGHDLHMAAWTGAATLLATLRNHWHGTVVMVGQPAEETVAGARALVADGLFTRFPKPDAILAVHDRSDLPVGRVTWVAGYTMANVDTVDITVFGRGSHGARPELSVDPIVLAARLVLSLQTIISREKDPLEPAVLTVGSIHGGTRPNIIPDEVHLQLTLRSYGPVVRQQLIDAIRRMAKAEAMAAGAPKEPLIALSEGQEACWNDPALTRRIATRLARDLGAAQVTEGRPDMVAEDFGELGKALGVPSVLLRTGTVPAAAFQAAQASHTPLPSLHSSAFAPDREGGIQTAVKALVLSALEVLDSKGATR